MIRLAKYVCLSVVILLSGCKPTQESYCYPTRIKTTSTETGYASDLILDYKYSENGQFEKIVRSDSQTYYYTFNEKNNISKIARKNVISLRKHESVYIYDGELPTKIHQYLMRLDPETQEDEDTSYIGFNNLEYEGDRIISETVYMKENDSEEFEITQYFEFEYDNKGNIINFLEKDNIDGDTIEAYSYQYSYGIHPLSALNIGFERESYTISDNPNSNSLYESAVNFVSEKTDIVTGTSYKYEIRLNASSYPDQINTIEQYPNGSNRTIEYINVEYDCH